MAGLADWADMMPDTLVAQPGYEDHEGTFTASGQALNIACHIESDTRLVRSQKTGAEVTSSATAYLGAVHRLTLSGYRFTLPAELDTTLEEAIRIDRLRDEDGEHHEVVVLP